MNFMITRAEITLLTGTGRTETFALQNCGKLKVFSGATCKGWFELSQVLNCMAASRDLPLPDDRAIEMHARLVMALRLKKSMKTP